MNKTVLALAAATALAVSVLAAPPAEARCWGCAVGVGVAAGVVTGAIVGSAIANSYGPTHARLALDGIFQGPHHGCGAMGATLLAWPAEMHIQATSQSAPAQSSMNAACRLARRRPTAVHCGLSSSPPK